MSRTTASYQFGPFTVDATKRLLLRERQTVSLTPKAFDTLLVLIENHGQVVDKDDLMKQVWPDTIVEEGGLTRNISVLRKVLGEKSDEHQFIVTIPARGYTFVADVKKLQDDDTRTPADRPDGSTSAPNKRLRWIAVLPFRELNADVNDACLGLGIADSLITKLSNVGSLMIRPTSAVRRYAEAELDPIAVGRELKVESVLEGSIQRLHERIRVTVQLVSATDGRSLWAGKFDGEFEDVFAIEDHVSERVAESLVPKLSGDERELLKKHYTENTDAYQAYLKGRFYWKKWSVEGFKKEIEYFNQAIRIDPTYALAYAGLADTYYRGATSYLPPLEALPKMKAAAMKALEIDSSLAEAHASLGVATEYFDWNWTEAEDEFKRSLELNANYSLGHLWYGLYLMEMGRLDESVAEIKQAQELDPLSLEINAFLALPHFCAHQYDRAMEQLKKTIEMEPHYPQAHYFLGWVYEKKGQVEEAIVSYQTAMNVSARFPMALAALGHALGLSGRTEDARAILAELNEMSRQSYVSPYDVALVHLGLGEKDLALACLEKAFTERSVWLVRLKVDLRLEPLYDDARFTKLAERVGLHA